MATRHAPQTPKAAPAPATTRRRLPATGRRSGRAGGPIGPGRLRRLPGRRRHLVLRDARAAGPQNRRPHHVAGRRHPLGLFPKPAGRPIRSPRLLRLWPPGQGRGGARLAVRGDVGSAGQPRRGQRRRRVDVLRHDLFHAPQLVQLGKIRRQQMSGEIGQLEKQGHEFDVGRKARAAAAENPPAAAPPGFRRIRPLPARRSAARRSAARKRSSAAA